MVQWIEKGRGRLGVHGSSLGQDIIEFFLAFSDQYNAILSAYLGELSKLQSFLFSIFSHFCRFITTLDQLSLSLNYQI